MTGLEGLNISRSRVAIGPLQLKLPNVVAPADLTAGQNRLPRQDEVKGTDGGIADPTALFKTIPETAA